MSRSLTFSVITPSLNMLDYLRACCNSISDQGVEYEHIVVDGLSQDGTVEWLCSRPEIISLCERDDGMYDAINKGIQISKGEIIAYLNCDEQYLPGVLQIVQEFFQNHPQVDLLFGNSLVIRSNGKLLSFRKGFVPRWPYIWASYMYVHSGSMFIRRKVFEAGISFDQKWKTIGDADLVVRCLRRGFIARHINQFFSAFMLTGSNLGSGALALNEIRLFRMQAPWWLRHSTIITNGLIRIEKLFHGAYWVKGPLSYEVFTITDPVRRTHLKTRLVTPFYPRSFKINSS
jgi:glycosyltransferase involved in cell wall biosynthesis